MSHLKKGIKGTIHPNHIILAPTLYPQFDNCCVLINNLFRQHFLKSRYTSFILLGCSCSDAYTMG